MSYNVQVLIEASPMRGSNGILLGPDGKLYVGSVWHNAAFIVDPETGDMQQIEGAKGTDDMAFHPDGRLFFNWITTGEVGVMDTDGKVSVAAKLLVGNDGIAISKDGRIVQIMDNNEFITPKVVKDGLRSP